VRKKYSPERFHDISFTSNLKGVVWTILEVRTSTMLITSSWASRWWPIEAERSSKGPRKGSGERRRETERDGERRRETEMERKIDR
jgi:hypothetical protein